MRIETTVGQIDITRTECSRYSPFSPRILLVDPWKLGTHEECVEGYNFSEIDFSEEYRGPAIAVAQEDGSDALYLDGKDSGPIYDVSEYGDLGVLDGRHRLEKSRLLRWPLVPIQIFPVRDPRLVLGTWLQDFEPLKIEDVLTYFKHPDLHVLPKATKFQAVGTDGNLYRLSEIQPQVRISAKALSQRR